MNTLKKIGIQQWKLKTSDAITSVKERQPKVSAEQEFNPVATENPTTPEASPVDTVETQLMPAPVPMLESKQETNNTSTKNDGVSQLDWQGLQATIDGNQHCPSCGVGNTLLGSGSANAQWLFVVDAPNSREVAEQRLFTGRSGELFDAMLNALNLSRADVYASSIFKCAPTEDLSATPQCNELLHRQIELIAPKVVVTFGGFAAQSVIRANEDLESLRLSDQRCVRTKVPVIPSYSPTQMLDDPSLKTFVWQDLKKGLRTVQS